MIRKERLTCAIINKSEGPLLRLTMRLKLPRVEKDGLRIVLADEHVKMNTAIRFEGMLIQPIMVFKVFAQVPKSRESRFKFNKALAAAREKSPILM